MNKKTQKGEYIMATMKKSLSAILIIGSIIMMLSSCKKDETTSPNVTFATSDIEGVWSGSLRFVAHGGTSNGMDTTTNQKITFGPNGTLISIYGWPVFITKSGNLTVAADGKITGIITTTHTTGGNNVETTTMNWAGSTFETKTKINTNMNWPWNNTAPDNGYFLITGSLNKQ
jgi:hypothetical protein